MQTKLTIIFCILICSTVFPLFSVSQEYRPPEPVGGESQMEDFLCNEMIYPEHALNENIKGTVVIHFTVTKDGKAINPFVESSGNEDIDMEALRIFRKILWNNAIRMGKSVDSEHTVKIKFDPKKFRKNCKKRGFEEFSYETKSIDTSNTVYELKDLTRPPAPVFDKGQNLNSFISNNLKYPDAAFKQNISGEVELSYVVEPHGGISHIVIENPLGGGCSQEAIRIVRLLKYKPGMIKDTAVRSRVTLSIYFRLHDKQGVNYVPNTPTSGY